MTFDDAARARIAGGWASSSLDQPTYAAQHGISTRTLREWVSRYGTGRRPQAQLRAAIVASIEQLQNVLAALDAAGAAGSEDDREVAEHEAEQRHASSAGPATARATPAAPEAEPRASRPRALDAGGGADRVRRAAVRDDDAAGDEREVAGPEGIASERASAHGAVSAAVRQHPAARSEDREARGSSKGNDAPAVVNLEVLRTRAAQLRAARAATGALTRQVSFDWDAE